MIRILCEYGSRFFNEAFDFGAEILLLGHPIYYSMVAPEEHVHTFYSHGPCFFLVYFLVLLFHVFICSTAQRYHRTKILLAGLF